MSHLKERKEKDCLNCGATVTGRYCQDCGQENLEPKETVWHLITHFFNDITHFDGKFFSTLKLLIIKPGFLAEEYRLGRRTKYLNPIRLYLFVSALFFLTIFSIIGTPDYTSSNYSQYSKNYIDSLIRANDTINTKSGITTTYVPNTNDGYLLLDFPVVYKMGVKKYDSLQSLLPSSQQDFFLKKFYVHKMNGIYSYFRKHPLNFAQHFIEKLEHSFPKVFFCSLPIFAFLLFLLFIGKRKNYYYSAHAVFSIHYYCVLFFLLICWMSYAMYFDINLKIWYYTLLAATFLYLLVAIQRFYKQMVLFTILTSAIQYSFMVILLGFLTFVFAIISMASAAN